MYSYQPQTLQPVEDPELARLQRKIKRLVRQLAKLQQTKSDIEQQILLLHTRHRQELGQLIAELLQLRRNHRQRAARPPTPDPEILDDEVNAPADVRPDKLPKLTPVERRTLKEMFRQASKLCHPDLVAVEFKAEASLIFIELKTAYEQHNLQRVEEILHMLERGERLTRKPAWGQDKGKLRAEIEYLKTRIEAARQEIKELKQSNAYQKLSNIEDWEDYFDDFKAELQRKINRLKRKKPQG
ncbi:MAG: hypothetical protein HYR94_09575 [Chloroflexi bacterium]|nr:hypothetical protein [Chloroflexota bacterium]